MILKILKLHSPKSSCNFENFQNHSYLLITNCTRGRAISYTYCTPIGPITTTNHTRDKQIGLSLRGRPILLSLVWLQTLQTRLDFTQSYYHYLLVYLNGNNAAEWENNMKCASSYPMNWTVKNWFVQDFKGHGHDTDEDNVPFERLKRCMFPMRTL